tara:strand:+ start:107 stop:361 length:255 start_codon:yes stop_codon:yes gene_type:complete
MLPHTTHATMPSAGAQPLHNCRHTPALVAHVSHSQAGQVLQSEHRTSLHFSHVSKASSPFWQYMHLDTLQLPHESSQACFSISA